MASAAFGINQKKIVKQKKKFRDLLRKISFIRFRQIVFLFSCEENRQKAGKFSLLNRNLWRKLENLINANWFCA